MPWYKTNKPPPPVLVFTCDTLDSYLVNPPGFALRIYHRTVLRITGKHLEGVVYLLLIAKLLLDLCVCVYLRANFTLLQQSIGSTLKVVHAA